MDHPDVGHPFTECHCRPIGQEQASPCASPFHMRPSRARGVAMQASGSEPSLSLIPRDSRDLKDRSQVIRPRHIFLTTTLERHFSQRVARCLEINNWFTLTAVYIPHEHESGIAPRSSVYNHVGVISREKRKLKRLIGPFRASDWSLFSLPSVAPPYNERMNRGWRRC